MDNMGREKTGKATWTQQEMQTTILISLLPWQDTIMQKREEAQMSGAARNHDSVLMNPSTRSSRSHWSPDAQTKPNWLILPFSSRKIRKTIIHVWKVPSQQENKEQVQWEEQRRIQFYIPSSS